ncbi:Uncharacterised protein [uncultured Blautia sp.]|jgi:hypothetical protein|nr:Uncharacterised protein [uncultured Blautia sp.]
MSFPANTPHTAENMGLTPKNSRRQTAIPALPANVAANHGQPIINSIANIDQKINGFMWMASLLYGNGCFSI